VAVVENKKLPYPAVVGGHICLDVIPTLYDRQSGMNEILVPGKLVDIGPAVLATGGAVSNTGLALNRLGLPAQLMGKVGDDWFGSAIVDIIRKQDPALAEGMIVAPGEASSYTIVINPPGVDRIFLHCTGANDTFGAEDLKADLLQEAGLFHFGYPPLMRRMYDDGGIELERMMAQAKAAGATTSLDLAKPDPASAAGQADWRTILKRVLPQVDLFLPSFEEVLFMLRRELYDRLEQEHGSADLLPYADAALLREVSGELLEMGAAVVVIKLGEYGLYMRTTDKADRLVQSGRYTPADCIAWASRELYAPCFKVKVAGTTGAGDCTIAGFLGGWMQGLRPEEALISAVAVGACNVEQADATSGVLPWENVQERVAAGWSQHPPKRGLEDFRAEQVLRTSSAESVAGEAADASGAKVWLGPADQLRR